MWRLIALPYLLVLLIEMIDNISLVLTYICVKYVGHMNVILFPGMEKSDIYKTLAEKRSIKIKKDDVQKK